MNMIYSIEKTTRGLTMPVFDFNQIKKDEVKAEKTYELIYSNERFADLDHPILILEYIIFSALGTLLLSSGVPFVIRSALCHYKVLFGYVFLNDSERNSCKSVQLS